MGQVFLVKGVAQMTFFSFFLFFLCGLFLFSLVSSDVGLFGPLLPTGEMIKLCCVVL